MQVGPKMKWVTVKVESDCDNSSCTGNELTAFSLFKDLGRNKKLSPHGITTVRIIRKSTVDANTTIHKHHHHGGFVCPSYGVGSMDLPDLMQGTSLEGVGQERLGIVLYKRIQ